MSAIRFADAAAVVAQLRPGMNVFVPGVSGESLAFYQALQANPQAAEGVRFVGVHFPGINRSDYLGLHPTARQRGYFMQPGLRAGLADGRGQLLPLDYPGIWADLSEAVSIDLAIVQVSLPDEVGRCSLGPSQDFIPAVWGAARRRIAHVNPRMPRTQGSFSVHLHELDGWCEQDFSLLTLEDEASVPAPAPALVAHVASLIDDGATLECGVGRLPGAVLAALSGHRDLRIWSGMATSPMADLIDRGVIRGRAAVQAGVALGDAAFYRRIGEDDGFYFRPVNETHNVLNMAAIDRFTAVNSAVQVDLFGQVNVDTLGGRQLAGVGGLPAFVEGARLSPGGRSIIAMNSATEDGRHSRIVATIAAGSPVALPRHCADYVVTEHGIAALRGLDLEGRAQALISVAAPAFRESLGREWVGIKNKL